MLSYDYAVIMTSFELDYSLPSIGFGIDIGGSGIKGAPVDLAAGALATKRHRIPTPASRQSNDMLAAIAELLAHFQVPTSQHIGITFPGVIQHGVIGTAANLSKDWIGQNLQQQVFDVTGHSATVVNDADAAGFAEVALGAAQGQPGVVLVLTLGTGIGSALIHDGVLVPNTELGHLEIDGHDAESRAAASIKDLEGLSYPQYAERLQRYLETVEFLFSPDLLVIGGGISKDHEEFLPLLKTKAPIVPATLRNKAGIIGAALLAERR